LFNLAASRPDKSRGSGFIAPCRPARKRRGNGQQGNRVKEGRKQFFFEKKNQKTFAYWAHACGQSEGVKVFCFFFSKKKTFL
jgi:hypothetical protein